MDDCFPILLLLWKQTDLSALVESNFIFAVLKAVTVLALYYLAIALVKTMAIA
jgi:hypothetical protein